MKPLTLGRIWRLNQLHGRPLSRTMRRDWIINTAADYAVKRFPAVPFNDSWTGDQFVAAICAQDKARKHAFYAKLQEMGCP